MTAPTVNEIESQFSRLTIENQLSLLERLVHHVRQSLGPSEESWHGELSAMAADPQIQNELRQVDSEFRTAETDGLGKS